MKYRKKPVVIDAIKWDGLNLEEVKTFVGDSLVYYTYPSIVMKIKTLEGEMQVNKGDYIIKGIRGEFYPCKPAMFEATYEAVEFNNNILDEIKAKD